MTPTIADRAHPTRGLLALLGCVFVAMIGFGITLPVLPFYTERLARAGGASARDVAIQVGLLTAVYPLAQLAFAPLWGHWSDSLGRKRVVLVGIAGAALGQTLFAFATTLPALYAARTVGGVLTAALFPAAAAYVSDATATAGRARGMAWLGIAASMGAVVGPGLGGLLAQTSWQLRTSAGRVIISSFAVPFLAAAALAVLAFAAALMWVPDSPPAPVTSPIQGEPTGPGATRQAPRLGQDPRPGLALQPLLMLAVAGQFGLALFEATFALYASRMWRYGPSQIGTAFMVCGLVMALAQVGVTTARARRMMSELMQVAAGFGLVAASLAFLPAAGVRALVLLTVAVLAFGLALIVPNLAALITTRSSRRRIGSALGAGGGGEQPGAGARDARGRRAPRVANGGAVLRGSGDSGGGRCRGRPPGRERTTCANHRSDLSDRAVTTRSPAPRAARSRST